MMRDPPPSDSGPRERSHAGRSVRTTPYASVCVLASISSIVRAFRSRRTVCCAAAVASAPPGSFVRVAWAQPPMAARRAATAAARRVWFVIDGDGFGGVCEAPNLLRGESGM